MKWSRIGMLLFLLSLTLVLSLGKIGKWTLKQVKKLYVVSKDCNQTFIATAKKVKRKGKRL